MKNILTVLGLTGAATVPQLISALPHDCQILGTAFVAFAGYIYHLYQPMPLHIQPTPQSNGSNKMIGT